jgi:hypothetical protein
MDVAISSGVSTLEWINSLANARIDYRMVASDVTVTAFLVSVARQFEVLIDREGHPMHFDLRGRGMPGSASRFPHRLVSGILRSLFRAHWWYRRDIRHAVRDCVGEFQKKMPSNVLRIDLLTPRLKSLSYLQIIEEDITADPDKSLNGRFHLVRAANILNTAYFSDETLLRAVRNLRSRLQPGGLLAVCRTDDGARNNGTIFRLNGTGRLEVVTRVGTGSEIENLAVSLC